MTMVAATAYETKVLKALSPQVKSTPVTESLPAALTQNSTPFVSTNLAAVSRAVHAVFIVASSPEYVQDMHVMPSPVHLTSVAGEIGLELHETGVSARTVRSFCASMRLATSATGTMFSRDMNLF